MDCCCPNQSLSLFGTGQRDPGMQGLADKVRPHAATGEMILCCMSLQPESLTQEVLAGLVERVTYHNAENGFCVLRARARGHRDVVTVVGHAATIAAGEWITASGAWINDRTHGQQFKARFLRTSPPTSADARSRSFRRHSAVTNSVHNV